MYFRRLRTAVINEVMDWEGRKKVRIGSFNFIYNKEMTTNWESDKVWVKRTPSEAVTTFEFIIGISWFVDSVVEKAERRASKYWINVPFTEVTIYNKKKESYCALQIQCNKFFHEQFRNNFEIKKFWSTEKTKKWNAPKLTAVSEFSAAQWNDSSDTFRPKSHKFYFFHHLICYLWFKFPLKIILNSYIYSTST